jgi:hypothetical protein
MTAETGYQIASCTGVCRFRTGFFIGTCKQANAALAKLLMQSGAFSNRTASQEK